jgi:Protein of unknown function (DUF1416)
MGTTISGKVSAHGEAATSATVELHNETGDVVTQSQVDQEGRYMFHVKEGKWTINAWDAYGHTGRADATLADGDDGNLDLELGEPEGGH